MQAADGLVAPLCLLPSALLLGYCSCRVVASVGLIESLSVVHQEGQRMLPQLWIRPGVEDRSVYQVQLVLGDAVQ